jgi:tetratricopeptide (TPR) repeat protein
MKVVRLICFLIPLQLFAQIHSVTEKYDTDSLQRLVPVRKEKDLVDVYNKLAVSFAYSDPSQCESYAAKALSMANELGYKKGIADAEKYIGQMHVYAGKYPDAVVHFYNALDLYEQIHDNYNLAKLYYDLARVHFYAGNYQKCEEYGDKALELFLQEKPDGSTLGSLWDIATLKSGFGLLYRMTTRSEMAKEIYRWYCKVMNEEGFEVTNRMVHTLLLARCFDETGDQDSALWYLSKTLEFPEENESIRALKMESLRLVGMIKYQQGNTEEAEKCFEQVILWIGEKGFLWHSFQSKLMLGDISMKVGQIIKAEEYYLKAMNDCREMIKNQSYFRYDSLKYIVSMGAELYFPWPEYYIKTNIWGFQTAIMEKLFGLYQQKGDFRNAIHYHVLFSQAKDTLYELKRNRDLVELQVKYETDRKEQQIQLLAEENAFRQLRLNQSRIYLAGMGAMMLLLIIIGILLIRQSRIRTRQKMIILQQKLLRSQMNPHFIFNSMASIQDFILANDSKSAARYLSRFAKLIRNILDCSLEEMIPVSREIETIENFLYLQKVRLEEKFDFTITKDESVESEEIRLPAMLIQPFVENAIEHGIRHKPEKGMIRISFQLLDRWLSVRVEDNGVGRKKARELEGDQRKDHSSVSTYLIRERLKILNKKSRRKMTLEIIDLFDDTGMPTGTRIIITIPVDKPS